MGNPLCPTRRVIIIEPNHPRWTREELAEEGMGVAFSGNAVQYIRSHLI